MDCVQYGALCMPWKMSVTRVSRLHSSFNFNPSSLALSFSGSNSKHRTPLGHAFIPVISAHSKPSKNDKDDKKFVVKGIGGASTVVLACVLGLMSCNYKFTPRAFAVSREITLHPKSSKDVLNSLLMLNGYVAKPSPSKFKTFFKTPKLKPTSGQPNMEDCENLKIQAVGMIKAGMGDEAEKQLRDLYATMCKEEKRESAYYVEMALVSILIFQGKYEEAAKCGCLSGDSAIPSDDRVDLYKAIIHTMLGQNKEAKECWNEFIQLLDNEDQRF